jgi:hypothetical protein
LFIGGVPGGGGGAGPELHELPFFLSLNLTILKFIQCMMKKHIPKEIADNGNAYCRFIFFNCSGIQPVNLLFSIFLRNI